MEELLANGDPVTRGEVLQWVTAALVALMAAILTAFWRKLDGLPREFATVHKRVSEQEARIERHSEKLNTVGREQEQLEERHRELENRFNEHMTDGPQY